VPVKSVMIQPLFGGGLAVDRPGIGQHSFPESP